MRMRTFYGAMLLAPLLASAQTPKVPSLGATVEVSIVNVDVYVTDKNGHRVHGLTKNDFEIFENGMQRPISNFSEYDENVGWASARPDTDDGLKAVIHSPARTIILFFDRFHLPPFRNEPLFASLKKLLHGVLRPGDRAMVVSFDNGALVVGQALTDSLPALDAAIDRVAKLMARPMLSRDDEMAWMLAALGQDIEQVEVEALQQLAKFDEQRKVRAINALMRSIAAMEGKKIVLMAARRISREAGVEYVYIARPHDIHNIRTAGLDMADLIKTIETTANANGVTVYPVLPEGLQARQTDTPWSAGPGFNDYRVLANETPVISEIAEETGGLAAWESKDVEKLLPVIQEDLESYYSLAYRLPEGSAAKERKIVVKAKNPAYTVRARREFVPRSDVTRMEDRVIAALFDNPPSAGTIPLRVVVGARTMRGREPVVPVTVYIPTGALTAIPNGDRFAGAFSVYFAWGSQLGGMSDTAHETKSYRIPADKMAGARNGHFTYTIDLEPGGLTDRVALGVLDEVSKEYALRLILLSGNGNVAAASNRQ